MMPALFQKKSAWPALIWLALLVTAVFSAPFLKESSRHMDLLQVLQPPSIAHFCGTDSLGRDVLSRLIDGSRISLGVGVGAVALSLAIGVLLGAVAAYYGGFVDRLLMALVDTLLCFPVFFLILAVIAVLGPNIFHIVLIIGLTSWMGAARLVRAEVLTLRERDFIRASRVMGASDWWVLTKHLIPNALSPAIVHGILSVSSAILLESGLSFLGIGVQPPTPSWGNLLMDGKATLGVAWWLTVFPGFMIFFTVLSVNMVGERLSESVRGRS